MKCMPRPAASSSSDWAHLRPAPARVLTARVLTALAVTALAVTGLAVILVGVGAIPAGAESPRVVADELAIDGAYVAPERSDVDEALLVEQANQARALGLKLVVVVPIDPQPDAKAFARRVLEASDTDVAIVFPPGGGIEVEVVEDLESGSFRALAAARSKSDSVLATEVFIRELLAEPDRPVPAVVSQTIFGVLVLAAALAAVVILEQSVRRGGGRRLARGRAG
jgi:hypothetical protein